MADKIIENSAFTFSHHILERALCDGIHRKETQ